MFPHSPWMGLILRGRGSPETMMGAQQGTLWRSFSKIEVQPNPRKKTRLTTSFRSLGEVNCLPSAQPRLEALEQRGDRAPQILLCPSRPA